MKITHLFPQIISIENLLVAWEEFVKDKKQRADVQVFAANLLPNILLLNHDLTHLTYKHAHYQQFLIHDPKKRIIHKAVVRDRLVHHAIYRILYPIFDKGFIYDSYSCRLGKGTHTAVERLESLIRKVSKNYSNPCFALKCDIKKFFASVDHSILTGLIKRKIDDPDLNRLLEEIIGSFDVVENYQPSLFDLRKQIERERERERERESCRPLADSLRRGIPIGNLTSQLFANIYMNELDQFVKHKLKVKYYVRYADDFLILSDNEKYLQNLLPEIQLFLDNQLKLKLHPNKISIRKIKQGVDFLGYIVFPHYRLVRTKTKQRIFKKLKARVKEYKSGIISEETLKQSLNSFLGVLTHANTYKLKQELKNQFWFWLKE